MQLIPTTARATAKKHGILYKRKSDLYNAEKNILLAPILKTCIIDSVETLLWHQQVTTQVLTEYLNGKKGTVEIQSYGSMQFQSMKQGDMLGELYFIH